MLLYIWYNLVLDYVLLLDRDKLSRQYYPGFYWFRGHLSVVRWSGSLSFVQKEALEFSLSDFDVWFALQMACACSLSLSASCAFFSCTYPKVFQFWECLFVFCHLTFFLFRFSFVAKEVVMQSGFFQASIMSAVIRASFLEPTWNLTRKPV